jgi:hypothetical protein
MYRYLRDCPLFLVSLVLDLRVEDFLLLIDRPFVVQLNMCQP